MYFKKSDLIELFEANREITVNGCWLWSGGKISGKHGVIEGGLVHRLSAFVYLGFDLDDKEHIICHKNECHNSSCFNPNHLYIGTHKTNGEDRSALILYCKAGHEFNEENTYIATNGKYPKRQCRRCKADREAHRRRSRVTMLGGAFSEKLK